MTAYATDDDWERHVLNELERSRDIWGDDRGGGDIAGQTPLDDQENYVPAIRVASEAGYAHTWVVVPRIVQDENDQTEANNGPLHDASIIPPDILSSSRRLEEWVTTPLGQYRRGPTFEEQVYTRPYDDHGGEMNVSEDDEPKNRDDNDSSVPWATDDIRHFSSTAGKRQDLPWRRITSPSMSETMTAPADQPASAALSPPIAAESLITNFFFSPQTDMMQIP